MEAEGIRCGSKQSGPSFDLHPNLSKTPPAESGIKLWDKKDVVLKNEPWKLLKTQEKATWVAKNEPKNEAGKLLKTRACGKNEPKTNRTMLLKTKKARKRT